MPINQNDKPMQSYAFIIIPLTAGILAQVAKFVIYSIKHGTDWRFLLEYGHMPSSHTSMMSALIWTIGYYRGVTTPEFAMALVITILVMSDAMRLRMYVGSYGKMINNLMEHLRVDSYSMPEKLKERVGHKPSEIFAGVVLGVFTAVVMARILELL